MNETMYLITYKPCGTQFLVNIADEEKAFLAAVDANQLVGSIEGTDLSNNHHKSHSDFGKQTYKKGICKRTKKAHDKENARINKEKRSFHLLSMWKLNYEGAEFVVRNRPHHSSLQGRIHN